MPLPRPTNVYIDGFNFYYGSVKGTAFKWLDLGELCKLLLPAEQHTINRIRYFTAPIHPRPSDPEQPQRQQTYLRALNTIPNLTIHKGIFHTNQKRLPVVNRLPNQPRTVEVWVNEEKGSDVNLATYLLIDDMHNEYEAAVIISNDSDFVLPIEYIREQRHRLIGILNPHVYNPSRELRRLAHFYKPIRSGVLAASQFPSILYDSQGAIHKPHLW